MEVNRRTLLGAAAMLPLVPSAAAGKVSARIPLWPSDPPGATATRPRYKAEQRQLPGRIETWLTGIAEPTLEIVHPSRPNGVGLLIIPGGAYEFLAYTNEGTDIAGVFAAMGYTAGVLAYRLPAEGWERRSDVPLQDAQRGMRLLRAQADAPGLTRLGVIGSSAGGHLAATLATAFDERVYNPLDAADRLSARPDFAALLYPVATLELPATHYGSRDNLLGANPDDAAVVRRSPTRQVTARTPPSFVLHSFDDDIVPIDCAFAWINACRSAKRPVEAHLIERGGHGYSVHLPDTNPGALWPQQFHRWIGQHAASRT